MRPENIRTLASLLCAPSARRRRYKLIELTTHRRSQVIWRDPRAEGEISRIWAKHSVQFGQSAGCASNRRCALERTPSRSSVTTSTACWQTRPRRFTESSGGFPNLPERRFDDVPWPPCGSTRWLAWLISSTLRTSALLSRCNVALHHRYFLLRRQSAANVESQPAFPGSRSSRCLLFGFSSSHMVISF